jgi:hypothetical protein
MLKHQSGGPNNYKHKLHIRKIITVQSGIVLQVTEFSTSAADFRVLGRKILSFSRITHIEIQLKIELQGHQPYRIFGKITTTVKKNWEAYFENFQNIPH